MRKSLGVMGLGLSVVVLSGCLGSNDKLGEGFEGDFTEVGESESGVEVTINKVGYVDAGTSVFEEDIKTKGNFDYFMVIDMDVDNQSGERKRLDGVQIKQEEYSVGRFLLVGGYEGYEESENSESEVTTGEESNFWVDNYRAITLGEDLLDGESVRGLAVFGLSDAEETYGDESEMLHELDRDSSKNLEIEISGDKHVFELTESDREWDGTYLSNESSWDDSIAYEKVEFGDLSGGIVSSVEGDKEITDGRNEVGVSVREAVYFENVGEDFYEDIKNAGSLTRSENIIVVNVSIENKGDKALDLNRFEIRKRYEDIYVDESDEDVVDVGDDYRENVILLNRPVNERSLGVDVLERYQLIPFNKSDDGLLEPGMEVQGNLIFVSDRIEKNESYYIFYGTDQGVNKEVDEDDEHNESGNGRESIRINVVE